MQAYPRLLGGPRLDSDITRNIRSDPATRVGSNFRAVFFFSARELLRHRPDGDLTANRYDKL